MCLVEPGIIRIGCPGRRFFSHENLSAVFYINAGQYLYQSGFACAVLTHKGMDLAASQSKIHVLKSIYTWKIFADSSHLQQFTVFHNSTPLLCFLKRHAVRKFRTACRSITSYLLKLFRTCQIPYLSTSSCVMVVASKPFSSMMIVFCSGALPAEKSLMILSM